ncbi:hypothetical protein AY601_2024 [Pedobacter cryoconitis]|uniref:Cytochrome c domain-containing protein n=1 Tax=Pedobacter cryoconitis TaxID=188932 RepID=A0A127VCH2_9SPHI|nr:hypothetical protein AY601_2024 [Pedobacter cryoconitis]
MVSNIIRLSLGSFTICLFLSSCNSQESKHIKDVTYTKNDTCRLDLSKGEAVILKLGECRYCHLINDVPRFKKNIPIFKELAAFDSLKLSNFIFVGKHNGMYKKVFPQVVKRVDSLDDCQKQNLIHFIKDAGLNQLVH